MADRAIYPGSIKNTVLLIENADGTTTQSIIAAGTSGSRINTISITSTDTNAVDLLVYHYDGTTDILIGRISIPALSGSDGVAPPISLLNTTTFPFLGEDLSYYIMNGHSLRIAAVSTVTLTFAIQIVSTAGDY